MRTVPGTWRDSSTVNINVVSEHYCLRNLPAEKKEKFASDCRRIVPVTVE